MCLHSSSKCTFFFSCERKNYSSVLHLEVWEDISLALVALKDNFLVTYAATAMNYELPVKHVASLRGILFKKPF